MVLPENLLAAKKTFAAQLLGHAPAYPPTPAPPSLIYSSLLEEKPFLPHL